VEICKLIRDVSKKQDLIFSTHIMQEVQGAVATGLYYSSRELVADDRLSTILTKINLDRLY